MARMLILAGIALLAAGLVMLLAERFNIGRLPGDIVIERENFTLYFPLGTMIVLSVALSLIFWFLSR
jgi:hypothetical protein